VSLAFAVCASTGCERIVVPPSVVLHDARVVVLPPAIEPPASVACDLGDSFSEAVPLRLFLADAAFARVSWRSAPRALPSWMSVQPGASGPAEKARGRLLLPEGDASQGAYVALEVDVGRIEGRVRADDVWLYPHSPIAISGFVVPHERERLLWRRGDRNGLIVEYDVRDAEVDARRPPLRARVACEDVGTSVGHFQVDDAIPSLSQTEETAAMSGTPIALAPAGPVVAQLAPEGGVAAVAVRGRSRGYALVVWKRAANTVFGWVPVSSLASVNGITLGNFGTVGRGAGSGTGQGWSTLEARTCAQPMPLVVDNNGRRATVGLLNGGIPMDVVARRGDYAAIRFASHSLSGLGADWLVPTALLDLCQPSPPSVPPSLRAP
jgi:hypothetical protein